MCFFFWQASGPEETASWIQAIEALQRMLSSSATLQHSSSLASVTSTDSDSRDFDGLRDDATAGPRTAAQIAAAIVAAGIAEAAAEPSAATFSSVGAFKLLNPDVKVDW